MNKIFLIIQREYLSRVKKKSFLILTFAVPIMIIAMYALVIALSVQGGDNTPVVDVVDESELIEGSLKETRSVTFRKFNGTIDDARAKVVSDENAFVLYIPADIRSGGQLELLSQKKSGLSVISTIEDQVNDRMRIVLLQDAGIDVATLDRIKPDISVVSKEITPEGEKDSSFAAAMSVGFAAAILIYLSLFIYGIQVMRGVLEEKTSRIVEVVISSVRPFQLMMGKIIGIGLVGLTQFLLWIILSASLMSVASNVFPGSEKPGIGTAANQQPAPGGPGAEIMGAIQTVEWAYILPVFLIFFFGGYLLYSALFAAVGSAVDTDTESQQFTMPITMPLLFTYIMAFSFIVNNPQSSLSFWLSIIPFTSPIAMMVRLPFGVPAWELTLSIVLLIGGFIFTTWVAARIYRVGILMYGKKVSFGELAKWFMYKG